MPTNPIKSCAQGLVSALLCCLPIADLKGAEASPSLNDRAWSALTEVLTNDRSAAMLHAGDAFFALGKGEEVRDVFTRHWTELSTTPRRDGAMRERATGTKNLAERAAVVAEIEYATADPSGRLRTGGFENLCKLHYLVQYQFPDSLVALARATVATEPVVETVFPLWVLQVSGGTHAAAQLSDLLISDDLKVRLLAAYALRWIHPSDPLIIQEVTAAADAIKTAGPDVSYLLSAALVLNPAAPQAAEWRSKLLQLLLTGEGQDRYQASQALLSHITPDELPQLAPLLTYPDPDARVSAAWIILHVNAKSEAARSL